MSDEFDAERERLVDQLRERGHVTDEDVIAALRSVPRHEFVPGANRGSAYTDRPLPIGEGQTISAPHMVGIMVELLDPDPGDRVLEVGTGCGYHAAVLAELAGDGNVYGVEYHESLAEAARERLAALGYDVHVRVGDGKEGWPEHAPFDAVSFACAASSLPDPVLDQLRPGGRLVAPVGDGRQTLVLVRKREDGSLERESHGGVRFVRMQ